MKQLQVKSGTYEEDIFIISNVTIVAPNGATIANTSRINDGTGVTWQNPVGPKIVGFTFTDWRQAINADGPDASNDGNWEVRDSIIIGGSCAVCAPTTEGEWTLENVTIRDADTAVSAYDNSGDWVIRNSKFRESGEILAFESSGNWVIDGVTIHDATGNGINVGNSSGDWTVSDTVVDGSSSDAVIGENTVGNWTIDNTTIQDAEDVGIEIDDNSGNWLIKNTDINGVGDEGIDMTSSKGDVQITGTTVRNTGGREYNNAIRIEDSVGNWTIRNTTIENISGEGIDAYNQPESSQATIRNLTVRDTQNHGVNFYNSSGDWEVIDSYISSSERVGVEASDTTGDWRITSTTVETTNDSLIGALGAAGSWKIHDSKLLASGKAINANGATTAGNASYNYWGAVDGPSGDFNGSGASAVGNLSIEPYYIDSELTTLSTDSSADLPPEATFSYKPVTPTRNTTVTFDASKSTDSDGEISSYEWDFTGDGTVDATGEAATTTHTYSSAGSYEVTLTVTDNSGTIATATEPITVQPAEEAPETGLTRFDIDGDAAIDRDEAVAAVVAYNAETTIGGQPVDRNLAVQVIIAYNSDQSIKT